MSEPLGIDMPEFQLAPDRREYLRKHGTLIESKDKAGNTTYATSSAETVLVDDDGTLIYFGVDEAVRRERGMCIIEQTPQWILRAIMQHARGSYNNRENATYPETIWTVDYGIRQVLIMNKIGDDGELLKIKRGLLSDAKPLISRFLIRENPEYGETHFIGIRRQAIKKAEETDDPDQMTIPIVDRKKKKAPLYTLDDYLFPELRGLTADAVTAPGAPIGDA